MNRLSPFFDCLAALALHNPMGLFLLIVFAMFILMALFTTESRGSRW